MGGFHHEALFYGDARDFLDGTVPFVQEGLAAGEAVMVVVPEPNAGRLKWALGSAAERVLWLDMVALGRNPACIIPAWQEFVETQGSDGRAVRGIGEPAWAGRSAQECVECGHHEALLNVAFADAEEFRLMCPYDTSQLAPDVLQEARRNHPWITHVGSCGDYVEPRGRPVPFAGELPALGPPTASMAFTAADLTEVRTLVAAQAHRAGMSALRVLDVVVGVSELAANSSIHGGGRGELRTWLHDSSFICEVTDAGRITDPMVGRCLPGTDAVSGRGLWLVNNLCDFVQIRSGEGGTTVRVHMAIDELEAALGEEGAQEGGAFLGAWPAFDDGPVVEPGLGRDV